MTLVPCNDYNIVEGQASELDAALDKACWKVHLNIQSFDIVHVLEKMYYLKAEVQYDAIYFMGTPPAVNINWCDLQPVHGRMDQPQHLIDVTMCSLRSGIVA